MEDKIKEIVENPIYYAIKERDKYWENKIEKEIKELKEKVGEFHPSDIELTEKQTIEKSKLIGKIEILEDLLKTKELVSSTP